jgi:spore maturation protein CgeB
VRILIVDTFYPTFLARHYARRPELAAESYDAQRRALMDTFFGTSDAYSHNLRPLGTDAHEVVSNSDHLQEAWAHEHGVRVRRLLPALLRRQEILIAQARWFQPDVVYVQNMRWVIEPTLRRLRRHTKLLVGQIASEPPRARTLRLYDLVLTSLPHFVERFRSAGVDARYLKLAFDERVNSHLGGDDGPGRREAVFVGTLNRTQHKSANAILGEAAEQAPIDFWGYSLDGWAPESAVRCRYHGEAWGLDMYQVLRDARIALNRHIEIAEDCANNMRLYEATGVGTMLLTDEKRNLSTLYEPGVEVATYRGADDLVAKIRYYLANESERAAIAAAGQARTQRDHTYAARMHELAEILSDVSRQR